MAFTDSESGPGVSQGGVGLLWPSWDRCVCLHRRRRHTYPQHGRERCSRRQNVSCPPSRAGRQAQAATGRLPGQESAQLRALIDKHQAIQLHKQRHNSPQPILTPIPLCSGGFSSHLADQQIEAHSLAKPHFCWQGPYERCWDSGLLGKLCLYRLTGQCCLG